jgi:hypothetical protein
VLELTLIEAALRDGQHALARSLCEARRARKPDSPGPRALLARLAVAPAHPRRTAAPGRSDAA